MYDGIVLKKCVVLSKKIRLMGLFAYIKFWFRSTNEHGVHSPFVFNLLTKAVYVPKERAEKKDVNWFFVKLFRYFEPDQIRCLSHKPLLQLLSTETENNQAKRNGINAYVVDETASKEAIRELGRRLSEMGNNDFVVVDKRNKTSDVTELSRELFRSPLTTAALDFYFYDVYFFRREQKKQYFRLKLVSPLRSIKYFR